MDPIHGGPSEGIRNSVPIQNKAGVQNEVVCFDSPDAPFLKEEKILIHAIGPAKGPYAYCPGFAPWLRENLLRFDILIIHGLWLYNSYRTFQIWKNFQRKELQVPKIFVMPHGMLDPYFQRDKSRRIKAIRNWLFWRLVEKRVVNGVDGVLFTCEQELLLARETFVPYHPKMEIKVGYGIKSPPIKKLESVTGFHHKCSQIKFQNYWLFLSRIHPKKGVHHLINAYLKLKEQENNIPALVIAGPGLDTKYGKAQVRKGRGKDIFFPGMLTGNAKWGAFHGCEAFILPSHQENFGIAIVEAMACGKPVLITDGVNIWREIAETKAGLVCKDSEKGIFSMLKCWFTESAIEKRNMGARAATLFKQKFSIEESAKKMIKMVKQ